LSAEKRSNHKTQSHGQYPGFHSGWDTHYCAALLVSRNWAGRGNSWGWHGAEGKGETVKVPLLLTDEGIDVMTITVLIIVPVIVVVEEMLLLLVGLEAAGKVITVVVEPSPTWTHRKSPGKIWHTGKTRVGFQEVNSSCEMPKLVQIS
jgi:hypothetical protein